MADTGEYPNLWGTTPVRGWKGDFSATERGQRGSLQLEFGAQPMVKPPPLRTGRERRLGVSEAVGLLVKSSLLHRWGGGIGGQSTRRCQRHTWLHCPLSPGGTQGIVGVDGGGRRGSGQQAGSSILQVLVRKEISRGSFRKV